MRRSMILLLCPICVMALAGCSTTKVVTKPIAAQNPAPSPQPEETYVETVPTKFFKVRTDGQYNQGFVYPNGVNTWIVEMVKPTPQSPWLYSGTPTGGY